MASTGNNAAIATPESASPAPQLTVIADLGPELLSRIFSRLGPSPMYLASLPCVCTEWRKIVQDETWKLLCLDYAPVLCKAIGCSGQIAPAGGWAALFKFLTYCPGLNPSAYRDVTKYTGFGPDTPPLAWCKLVGHVPSGQSCFRTGQEVVQELRIKGSCGADKIYATEFCNHPLHRKTDTFACRGVVVDIPGSSLGRRAGVDAYLQSTLEQQQNMHSEAKHRCIYCKAPLFELQEDEGYDSDDDWSGFDSSGYVCGNGHLSLAIYGEAECLESFLQEQKDSKEEAVIGGVLVLERSELIGELCEHVGPPFDIHGGAVRFRESIDPFSVTERLRRLSEAVLRDCCADNSSEDDNERGNLKRMRNGFEWVLRGDFRDDVGNPVADAMHANDVDSDWEDGASTQEQEDSSLWDGEVTVQTLSTKPIPVLAAEDRRLRSETRCLLATFPDDPQEDPVGFGSDLGLDLGEADWPGCVPLEYLEVLQAQQKEVIGSAGILRTFLVRGANVTQTTKALQTLHSLHEKRWRLYQAKEIVSESRKQVIEEAMRGAGIPENFSPGFNFPFKQWPDPKAVCLYARKGRLSVDEVIHRQRIRMEEELQKTTTRRY